MNIRKIIVVLSLLLAGALLLSSLAGCAVSGYAYEIAESDGMTDSGLSEKAGEITSIKINGRDFDVSYDSSKESVFNGERLDVYNVGQNGKIIVNENGQIRLISGFSPFPGIGDVASLSEDEIKTRIENAIGQSADFSRFNKFSTSVSEDGSATLVWGLERGILRNVRIEVTVGSDGEITYFSSTDACPEDLQTLSIGNDERDEYLMKCLTEKYGSVSFAKINIVSEVLTLYKSKPAILYVVTGTDSQGFAGYTEPIVITNNT